MSDIATMMLDAVRKFSENNKDTNLHLIQIVIFDSSMCSGFALALDSAVKDSQSFWSRTKRKSTEVTLTQ